MRGASAVPGKTPGLPLVIGITGHRDLLDSDRAALEFTVRRIFSEFEELYPRTPLVLLSPLAEGADRLVARVALKKGIRLVVPLPMPQELYEADFEDSQSKAEFRSLLACAETVLTLVPASAYYGDEIRERNSQYAQVGAYIARHSHVLIALWDQVPSDKLGGTSQIVQFRLEGVPEPYGPRYTPLDLVASGPLYHVVTPRKSNSRTVGKAGKLRKLYPRDYKDEETARAAYDKIFSRIDKFNRDSQRYEARLADLRELSRRSLLSTGRDRLNGPLEFIMNCYALADSLATHFQRWTHGIMLALFVLAFLGVGFLQVYSDLEAKGWALAIYMGILLFAYVIYWMAKWNEYHSKYLDYRALAEGLRVQFFWKLAGLNKPVADHYLRKQRSELDWIRKAIRAWALSTESQEESYGEQGSDPERMRLVLSNWVEGQRELFERALTRDKRRLTAIKWAARVLFLSSLALSFIQLLLDLLYEKRSNPLIFSMGLVLLIAGLMAGYAERRALAEQIKQYAQMGTIFALARERLKELLASGEHGQVMDLIEEIGKEALRENGDWVLLHRERDVEVPT